MCRQTAPKDPLGMCPAEICSPIASRESPVFNRAGKNVIEESLPPVSELKGVSVRDVPGLRCLSKRGRGMLVVCSVLCADTFAQLPYPATAWIWQDWPWDLGSLHYFCSSSCSCGFWYTL